MGGRGRGRKGGGGGGRGAKVTTKQPTASADSQRSNPKKRTKLPSQYDFTPANHIATESPTSRVPVFQAPQGPGVRDYPPHTILFQTSTSQVGASPGQPPDQPQQPQQPQQSPISSQAQNLCFGEDEEAGVDNNTPTEPSLSEDRRAALSAMLTQPGRGLYTTVLSPTLEPGTTWFGYDKSKLTRKITKVLTNKFDGPYYSWSCVPRERRERYFFEFAKQHTWVPSITDVVQTRFEKICQLRIKDMVYKAKSSGEKPDWIQSDTLWEEMTNYWETEEAITRSTTTSQSRMSDRNGLGPHKHVSGQKSFLQVEQEMIEELGRPVSLGEVFIRCHTRADGTFVDTKAQTVAETYTKKRDAKLAELRTNASSSDVTSGVTGLPIEEDNELFLQSTFRNEKGHIYGIGSLESYVNEKPKHPGSFSSVSTLQTQLEKAHRRIEEQAAINEKCEAELTAQKAKINDLTLVQQYLSQTDPNFLDFVSARAHVSTSNPNTDS